MKTLFSGRSDMPFAMLLLAPSLILLGGLVAWPMISNIEISFLRCRLTRALALCLSGWTITFASSVMRHSGTRCG
jgi:multiple sugar transport system permease protein